MAFKLKEANAVLPVSSTANIVYFGLFEKRLHSSSLSSKTSFKLDKSIHSHEYVVFLKLLRDSRQDAGLSQVSLASKLSETQTFVSKCERGERRLDVIELRTWCHALGVTLPLFLEQLDKELMSKPAQVDTR